MSRSLILDRTFYVTIEEDWEKLGCAVDERMTEAIMGFVHMQMSSFII